MVDFTYNVVISQAIVQSTTDDLALERRYFLTNFQPPKFPSKFKVTDTPLTLLHHLMVCILDKPASHVTDDT